MPMNKSRRYGAAAIAAVATLSLASCGFGGSGGDSGGDDASTLDLLVPSYSDATKGLWEDVIDGFTKENPDIKVNLEVQSWDNLEKVISTKIQAGEAPDIYNGGPFAGFVEDELLYPVEEVVSDDVYSDFQDSFLANAEVDGTAYALPMIASARALFVNNALLAQAGVEAPTDWDELRTFGEALKGQGVEFPFALAVNYDQYTAWQVGVMAAQNGGSMISDDLSEWTINDPKVVEALEYWSSLVKDGLASPDGPQFLDTVPWTSQGKNAAIVDGGPWFASWFDDANGEGWGAEHLAFVPNPVGPTGDAASTTGGGSWFVPSDAENKDAAWKFARWMSQPEQQIQWYEIFKNMPALKAAWDEPEMQGDPLLDTVRESLEVGVPRPNVPTWSQVGDMIGQQIETVVRGDVSAQDALDEAQKQAEAIGMGTK